MAGHVGAADRQGWASLENLEAAFPGCC
jgi:hypothetical protein